MANGTPTGATRMQRLVQEARAQEDANRHANAELQLALKLAITSPQLSRRAHTCVAAVGWESDTPLILVGLPSGERWEIPLSPKAAEMIAGELRAGPDGKAAVSGESALRVAGARG